MSTIKHPVGPRSDKVYRRRRLVVGLGLLAVIIVIVLIIVKPGSSVGEPGRSPSAAQGTSTDGASASSKPVTADTGAACDPANVTVEALTDADAYGADQLPELSLSLTNTGSASCVIDAGTAKQVFTITSGDDVWWTSTDCQTGAADAPITLAAGATEKSSAPLTWDRTRSAKDTCESDSREVAPAEGASYYLSVTVDGIAAAEPSLFLLN
jgi:hypothetical protein